eukprot:scaffold5816_cov267-Pinguiococcus_pyrenoidosus.AAC.18
MLVGICDVCLQFSAPVGVIRPLRQGARQVVDSDLFGMIRAGWEPTWCTWDRRGLGGDGRSSLLHLRGFFAGAASQALREILTAYCVSEVRRRPQRRLQRRPPVCSPHHCLPLSSRQSLNHLPPPFSQYAPPQLLSSLGVVSFLLLSLVQVSEHPAKHAVLEPRAVPSPRVAQTLQKVALVGKRPRILPPVIAPGEETPPQRGDVTKLGSLRGPLALRLGRLHSLLERCQAPPPPAPPGECRSLHRILSGLLLEQSVAAPPHQIPCQTLREVLYASGANARFKSPGLQSNAQTSARIHAPSSQRSPKAGELLPRRQHSTQTLSAEHSVLDSCSPPLPKRFSPLFRDFSDEFWTSSKVYARFPPRDSSAKPLKSLEDVGSCVRTRRGPLCLDQAPETREAQLFLPEIQSFLLRSATPKRSESHQKHGKAPVLVSDGAELVAASAPENVRLEAAKSGAPRRTRARHMVAPRAEHAQTCSALVPQLRRPGRLLHALCAREFRRTSFKPLLRGKLGPST